MIVGSFIHDDKESVCKLVSSVWNLVGANSLLYEKDLASILFTGTARVSGTSSSCTIILENSLACNSLIQSSFGE